MISADSITNTVQGFMAAGGSDFFIWLVGFPIAFMLIVTLILRLTLIKGNLPEPLHKPWFAILYIIVMYALGVVAGSLVYGFLK